MDTLGISDEAVRSAAQAMYGLENQGRSALDFASLPDWEVAIRGRHARAALEAAAPHMLAEAQEVAWAKGATSAGMNLMALWVEGINPNPYKTAK